MAVLRPEAGSARTLRFATEKKARCTVENPVLKKDVPLVLSIDNRPAIPVNKRNLQTVTFVLALVPALFQGKSRGE